MKIGAIVTIFGICGCASNGLFDGKGNLKRFPDRHTMLTVRMIPSAIPFDPDIPTDSIAAQMDGKTVLECSLVNNPNGENVKLKCLNIENETKIIFTKIDTINPYVILTGYTSSDEKTPYQIAVRYYDKQKKVGMCEYYDKRFRLTSKDVYHFDEGNKIIKVSHSKDPSDSTTFEYNNGKLAKGVNFNHKKIWRVDNYAYDKRGRLNKVTSCQPNQNGSCNYLLFYFYK